MQGYIIESRISAKDVDALNRSAVATTDVDGGTLVTLGELEDGVFKATKATSGQGLWMAYNPSEHLTKVGDKLFAGLSADPRDYTNLANRTMDVFKPQVGDLIGLTDGNFKAGESAKAVVGKYVEQGASGYEMKESATASTTSLLVKEIVEVPMPKDGIGNEFVKVHICEVAQN